MSRSFAMAVFALAAATTLDAAPPVAPPARPVVPVAVGAAEARRNAPVRRRRSSTSAGTASRRTTTLTRNPIWGPVMAGPTGDSIRALLAKGPKLLGQLAPGRTTARRQVARGAQGQPRGPQERREGHRPARGQGRRSSAPRSANRPRRSRASARRSADCSAARCPAPSRSSRTCSCSSIVPDSADQADVLFSAIRLLVRAGAIPMWRSSRRPRAARDSSSVATAPTRPIPIPIHVAWWVEGKHFVLYVGTTKPETVINEVAANAKKGGVTGHPLFQRIQKNPGFESVARGYVDAAKVVGVAKSIARAVRPRPRRAARRPRPRRPQGGRVQLRVRRQGVARDLGVRPARRAEGAGEDAEERSRSG